MIVLSGADLWTTNVMYMITSLLSRRITLMPLLISWAVSFLGNLAGSLFFMAIIMGYGGVFEESDAYTNAAITIAMQKCGQPQFHQIFLRAIGANWLVCFAVFGSIQARELASKVIAIWWPTATFVALALDHTIANMFFIPMGIWLGAPISVGEYIWKSMIASALGNIVGGGFFVGAMYWYLYLTGEAGVQVSFNLGSLETAIEGGTGPLRLNGRKAGNEPGAQSLEGIDPTTGNSSSRSASKDGISASPDALRSPQPSTPMPTNSAGQLVSAIGADLADDSLWAMKWRDREGAQQELKEAKRDGDEKV